MTAPGYAPMPGAAAPAKLPKAGFFWALGIFLVTAVIGGVLFVLGIRQLVEDIDDSQRISAPGQDEVQLDTGDAWVFASVPFGSAEELVDVRITDPDGTTRTLSQETIPTSSAETDGEQFVPLGFFDVDTPGTYVFDIDAPEGTDVRVGTLNLGKMLGFLFGGMAVGFVGFVIALILLIVTLVRRGNRKKQQRAAAYGGGGYPPAGGAYAPSPGYAPQAAPQQQSWPPQEPAPTWPPQDPAPPASPPPPPPAPPTA